MRRSHTVLAASAALALASLAGPAPAATLPPGFIEKRIGLGLTDPTALVLGPDGSGFVAERDGRVLRVKGDALVPEPALSLAVDTAGERGLLGLALDPTPGASRLYVAYAAVQGAGSQIRLSGFPVDGDKADASKEAVLLVVPNPGGASAALGGGLALGPDGKLYLGVGDLMQPELAQDLSTVNGKVLRLSTNGFVPADNPFYATAAGHGKSVYALGFGDPASLAFLPSGGLMVHDSKAGGFQEINAVAAGANHGWPAVSGPSADARFKAPLYAYAAAEGCASRGGDGHAAGRPRFPAEMAGEYLHADPCGGWIRSLVPATGERKDLLTGMAAQGGPSALRFGPQGDLYYATRGAGGAAYGGLFKLSYAPELSIRILSQPADVTVKEGESVTFRVTVEGPQPIRYQWRKDGVDIPGATAASLTLGSATRLDDGKRFSVLVSNDHGSAESRAALVTVAENNVPPRILVQPSDVGVRNGAAATFMVQADGSAPLRYQWNRKGVPIPGATSASYTLSPAGLSDNGADFFVEISNAGGLVTSRRAVLTVASLGHNALADVHWTQAQNGRGQVEEDMSNGESDSGDGDMISIGNRLYARGLGVYGNSEVSLNLSAGCDSFYAEVGLDGERGATGTVVFEVLADGAQLYRGPVMNAASAPVKLALPLTGRTTLRLRTLDAGDVSGNDYANWADARVKCWESLPVGPPTRSRSPERPRQAWYRLSGGSLGFVAPAGAGSAAHSDIRIHDLRGRLIPEARREPDFRQQERKP